MIDLATWKRFKEYRQKQYIYLDSEFDKQLKEFRETGLAAFGDLRRMPYPPKTIEACLDWMVEEEGRNV